MRLATGHLNALLPRSRVVTIARRTFAENPNDIAKRIASTKSIQKITKSMKMVSAAKLRGDTNRLMEGRPFSSAFKSFLLPQQYKTPLYVVITSDRGLCGGVNSAVAKKVKLDLQEDQTKGAKPFIVIIGDKGAPLLQRTHGKYVLGSFSEPWKQPMNFTKVLTITERLANMVKQHNIDVVKIYYNRFVNSIAYSTENKTVPVFPAFAKFDTEQNVELPAPLNEYELEYESSAESLSNIFEYTLAVQLYGSCLESATSEQSSRMTAMDNASKNAGEMVGNLTVRFNRARQARITTELIEIISGAESLKG